jgi:hypothetical protein
MAFPDENEIPVLIRMEAFYGTPVYCIIQAIHGVQGPLIGLYYDLNEAKTAFSTIGNSFSYGNYSWHLMEFLRLTTGFLEVVKEIDRK